MLRQTSEKNGLGVMTLHGGMSERKSWPERGTTGKISSCGAEQVLETRGTHAQG